MSICTSPNCCSCSSVKYFKMLLELADSVLLSRSGSDVRRVSSPSKYFWGLESTDADLCREPGSIISGAVRVRIAAVGEWNVGNS